MTFTEERARELHGDDVQQCPNCKGWHSGTSPRLCFACATGVTNSKGYHPEGTT